jgi:uncharacterized sporulation protein YeaH/YhbH (DUF444 family)
LSFGDEDTPVPARLFDGARSDDPRALEWANKEVEYVSRIDQLEVENQKLRKTVDRLRRKIQRVTTHKKDVTP